MAHKTHKSMEDLNDQELRDKIRAHRRTLFMLRSQVKTQQKVEKPHQFRALRHEIAWCMTRLTERTRAAGKGA